MKKEIKGFSLVWVLVIVVITSIIAGLTTGVIVYNNNKVTDKVTYKDLSNDEDLSEFLQVYANITTDYYKDVDKKAMLEKAMAAMMNYVGDDYTTYMDDEATKELVQSLSGEYDGIGVAINNTNKTITKVYDNTPASKAGIQAGDMIIGFNNEDVSDKTANEVVTMIKNAEGYFTLNLQRGDEKVNVSLKVETIIRPNIEYRMIEDTSIGYIYISTFSNTLDTQMKNALKELEESGMTALIIDLRENTGGYLDAATKVTSLFTEKGKKIYSLSYKNEKTDYFDETDEKRNYDIVVLVNKNTASASEIMAAALKESYGATIVGETTFGKGRVQQTMKLDDGSMVKYTSAYWLTPNGTCIDEIGIIPDYEVSNEVPKEESAEEGTVIEITDKQLEKAINILKGE